MLCTGLLGKTASKNSEHRLLCKQIVSELLIVLKHSLGVVNLRECVKSPLWLDAGEAGDFVEPLESQIPPWQELVNHLFLFNCILCGVLKCNCACILGWIRCT